MVSSQIIDPAFYSTLCAFILNTLSLTLLPELDEWVHKIARFVNAEEESGLFSSLCMIILWTGIIGMRLNCAFSS